MTVLLVIIYVSFISLGLPDGLLGAAWPVMSADFGAPLSFAGVISMITAGGTIVSSLLSERMIRRFGTGLVTTVSVLMTALALLGISLSGSVLWICILAVPLGLGAGSVDAALNNFVALHYKARHMNWLHCFWGVGASAGPMVMSLFIAKQHGWKTGYGTIGIVQVVLVAALFVALPLWKRVPEQNDGQQNQSTKSLFGAIKIRGVKSAMLIFLVYCSLEMTMGLWGSSYLVGIRGLSAETAAQWVSLYYLGITAGRFASGFVSMKLNNTVLIRLGILIIAVGLLAVLLPLGNAAVQIGFGMIGLGCAPIFPSMLHETPARFGKADSQKLVGLQMASAYTGSTLMPLVVGAAAQSIGIYLFPYFLLVMFVTLLLLSENLNRIVLKNKKAS